MSMKPFQLELIKKQLRRLVEQDGFYSQKLKGIDIESINSQEDFEKLPFSEKEDLRDAYPLGLQAVPDEEIVRIHSSSGTTGIPVIIPYTKQDVEDWAIMFARCFEFAGVTNTDRIQITPGYGLWTAGIGFQNGVEHLGAMAIPMGPGNTDKQLQMMIDLETTVICATSSYALLLAEEIAKRGLGEKIKLKKGVIGSERWGEKRRKRISEELGIELYDIYGLTEIYGPGIGINCKYDTGMHMWDDYIYTEVIDPNTGEVLPEGEVGELVLTTLKKEGAPLIRYRTHDLSRIIPGECPCGSDFTRIGTILGRTDDMVKVKGVQIYPRHMDEIIADCEGASSEYRLEIEHVDGKDLCTLYVEAVPEADKEAIIKQIRRMIKNRVGISADVIVLDLGELPRSEKKTNHIIDNRD